jgi:superfamily II DNA or RNA helicase
MPVSISQEDGWRQPGYSPEVIDAYWTLVGYFNSLRELGGTLTMIRDDIQGRFRFLAGKKFAQKYRGVNPERIEEYGVMELTSRKKSSEISSSIKQLERAYKPNNSGDVFDFVLATNMISVGVDVSRLGMMVVDGQPKSNSEYIQATSRVGRSNPGLVVVAENAAKSRDRSHFEQFYRFHSALYRNVDASSLTPFSERARDRALQAVFVTLCRNSIQELAENDEARNFRKDLPGVGDIIDQIVAYTGRIDPEEAADVRAELDEIADVWQQEAESNKSLCYEDRRKPMRSLLKEDTDTSRFRTMNSMRNVEASSNVFISR